MPDHNPGIIIIEIEYFGEQYTSILNVFLYEFSFHQYGGMTVVF